MGALVATGRANGHTEQDDRIHPAGAGGGGGHGRRGGGRPEHGRDPRTRHPRTARGASAVVLDEDVTVTYDADGRYTPGDPPPGPDSGRARPADVRRRPDGVLSTEGPRRISRRAHHPAHRRDRRPRPRPRARGAAECDRPSVRPAVPPAGGPLSGPAGAGHARDRDADPVGRPGARALRRLLSLSVRKPDPEQTAGDPRPGVAPAAPRRPGRRAGVHRGAGGRSGRLHLDGP